MRHQSTSTSTMEAAPPASPSFSDHFPTTNDRPQSSSMANCHDYSSTPQNHTDRRRKGSRVSLATDQSIERPKRGRRSKSDAMLALKSNTRHANRNRSRTQKSLEPGPSRNPLRAHVASSKNTAQLDFQSIRTEAPRDSPPISPENRLFGLEHCPIFYPTAEEFKDPMKYFESIGPKLKAFGIGKIVPPVGWRAPFMLDAEVNSSFVFALPSFYASETNELSATSSAFSLVYLY